MWRSSCPIGNVLQITAQSSDFATSSKTTYRLIYDNTTLNISTPSDLGGLTNGIIVQSRTAVLEFLDTGSSLDVRDGEEGERWWVGRRERGGGWGGGR